jgi:two-component system response regulator YesN
MLSLLVIDDEAIQRKGIVTSIDWGALDVTVTGEASNGEEGLRLIRERKPDLVITDIRMPVMDGLEMIEALSQQFLSGTGGEADFALPYFVILSGYDDFKYAQTALRLGASDYVLKPIDADELFALVGRIKEKIEEERTDRVQEELFRRNHRLLQSRFALDLISGHFANRSSIIKYALTIDVPLSGPFYSALIIEADDFIRLTEGYSENDRDLLCQGIENIAQETLTRDFSATLGYREDGRVIGILNCKSGTEERLREACKNIAAYIRQYFHYTVSIAQGNLCEGPEELPFSWEIARQRLLDKAFNGKNSLFLGPPVSRSRNLLLGTGSSAPEEHPDHDSFAKQIAMELRRGGDDEAGNLVAEMFAGFASRREDFPMIQNRVMETVSYLRMVFSYLDPDNGEPILHEISRIETLSDLRKWTQDHVDQIRRGLRTLASGGHGWMMQKILDYVEKHYAEEISVPVIAGRIGFSPNYFSKVFREQAGIGFSEWLNHFRIEQAKKLLRNSSEKIADIAEMTGYQDYKYFTYVFRQQEGISPSVFRHIGNSKNNQ